MNGYKFLIRAQRKMSATPKDYARIRRDLDNSILFGSGDIAPYIYRARLNFDERKYWAAIADWTDVIRLNPKNGEGNYDRGIVYQMMGHDKEAISDFARALELFDLFPDDNQDILRADIAQRLNQIANRQ